MKRGRNPARTRRFRRHVRVTEAWWRRLAPTAPTGLNGLWFGIVELAPPTPGCHLYVAGTETFDAEDETAEWAVPDYAWWPEGRYTPIPVDPDEEFEVPCEGWLTWSGTLLLGKLSLSSGTTMATSRSSISDCAEVPISRRRR